MKVQNSKIKMKNQKLKYFFLLFSILPFCYSYSQWSTDPYNNLIVGYGLLPEITSDSAGGCYITYEQNLHYPRRLILERLNRYGYKPWGIGKRILGELPEQSNAKITEDGQNGVIISYQDYYSGGMSGPWISRLRVQRIDSNGNFLWGPTGVRVTLSETNQHSQAIVSDGQGGCIVAWRDTLNTLRIQRVDVAGTRTWGDSGVYLYDDGGGPPVMISDLSGGVVMSWRYEKLQRVNRLGQKVWADTGITVYGGAGKMRIESNGQIYLLGRKFLGTINGELHFTVTMNKIDTSGVVYWENSGVILDTAITNNFPPRDFAVQNGFSAVAWPWKNNSGQWDLRTQIVRSDGSTVFPYGGIQISRTSSRKGIVGVLPSDSMTSVYVWGDNRTIGCIYSQKLDTLGEQKWDTNDVVLNIPMFSDMYVTNDCAGGAIGVGFHQFDFSIRALKVSKNGRLGEVITSVLHSQEPLPKSLMLYQNYPNPFNSSTIIKYDIPIRTKVLLEIYNTLGQKVYTLIDQVVEAGSHQITFYGNNLPSGVYYYKLTTNQITKTNKLIILK